MKSVLGGSLQRKLLAVMLLATLVALVVALGAMIGYDLRQYHRGWVADVVAQADLVGSTTAPALEFDDARLANEDAGAAAAAAEVPRGGDLRRTRRALRDLRRGGRRARAAAGAGRGRRDGRPGERRRRPPHRRQRPHARHRLPAGALPARRAHRQLRRHRVLRRAAVDGRRVAGVAAAALRVVTRPLVAMGKAARVVVEQRDYSRRVAKASEDEVGALVDAFNQMMDEVEQRTRALETSNQDKEREVDERAAAQREVMRLNEELEARVRRRTEQLERSNADLIIATQVAERANRAKSEFLSSMSHELRTPLNAILGFGQLLARSDDRPQPPERRQAFVGHIVEAGHHLLALINDILNLAQIEAGRLSISVESVALADVLVECRTMTEPQAAGRDVRLLSPGRRRRPRRSRPHAAEAGAAEPDVECRQVQPRARLGRRRLRARRRRRRTHLGPGHRQRDERAADRVAVPNPSTGSARRPARRGTGIGLVLTKRLVDLMGGTIGVSEHAGHRHARFWIDLKRRRAASARPLPAAMPAARRARRRTGGDRAVRRRQPGELAADPGGDGGARWHPPADARRTARSALDMARRHRPDVDPDGQQHAGDERTRGAVAAARRPRRRRRSRSSRSAPARCPTPSPRASTPASSAT